MANDTEKRLSALEANVTRLNQELATRLPAWEARNDQPFAAGTIDTASVMVIQFSNGRFTEAPVVIATAACANGAWLGGRKDSFSVTVYETSTTGFKALLRRTDPSGAPIPNGVTLNWIAVARH